MHKDHKFGTAINCMDGRVQEPVLKWMKEKFGLDYVDTITELGPDGVITRGETERIETIKYRLDISIHKHGSTVVVIAGHFNCAGNPVDREEHYAEIKKSLDIIRSWNLPVEVHGVWVNRNWVAEEVGKHHHAG